MLALWLFGVWAGVANACLTSPAMQSDDEGVALHVIQAATDAIDRDHAGPVAHHDGTGAGHAHPEVGGGDHHGLKSNCTDFCDKAGVAIPSSKSSPDDVQVHALQALAVAVIVTLPVFEPVRQWVPRRDDVRAPPIPVSIAFLRLAL